MGEMNLKLQIRAPIRNPAGIANTRVYVDSASYSHLRPARTCTCNEYFEWRSAHTQAASSRLSELLATERLSVSF